eukprot:Gb_15543 [translate_table: standard]
MGEGKGGTDGDNRDETEGGQTGQTCMQDGRDEMPPREISDGGKQMTEEGLHRLRECSRNRGHSQKWQRAHRLRQHSQKWQRMDEVGDSVNNGETNIFCSTNGRLIVSSEVLTKGRKTVQMGVG